MGGEVYTEFGGEI